MPARRVALLLAAVAACARSPSPLQPPARDASAPLQTDSLRYFLAETGPGPARIPLAFTTTNPGPDTVYVPTCGPHLLPVLERREGGGWATVQYIGTFDCLTPVVLPPGTTRRDTLQLCRPTSPVQSSCQSWRLEGIDGTYRLHLRDARVHYTPATGGDSVPERRRISNTFVIMAS